MVDKKEIKSKTKYDLSKFDIEYFLKIIVIFITMVSLISVGVAYLGVGLEPVEIKVVFDADGMIDMTDSSFGNLTDMLSDEVVLNLNKLDLGFSGEISCKGSIVSCGAMLTKLSELN